MSRPPTPVRTYRDDDRTAFHRAETQVRIVGVCLMGLLVVAALLGFLGPRESTSAEESGAGTVEVNHPHLTRAGLDSEVRVTLDGVEPGQPIRLLVGTKVLATLGLVTVQPNADTERSRSEAVEYEFLPEGDPPYTIRLSGRVPTKSAPNLLVWHLTWLPVDAEPVTLDARTWVLP